MKKEIKSESLFRPLKRGKRFYGFVRRGIISGLVRDHGIITADAERLVEGVTDKDLDVEADRHKVGQIGDGKIIQWLDDHKEQIWRIVMAFVTALSMFLVKPPKE